MPSDTMAQLAVVVAIPFVGRMVETFVSDSLFQGRGLCGGEPPNVAAKDGQQQEPAVLTVLNVVQATSSDDAPPNLSLSEMARELGWSPRVAVVMAGIRLVFWHWMQPVMYTLALFTYADDIDELQWRLGLVVLAREALYVVFTVSACVLRPVFLLLSFYANAGSFPELLLYVLCPEKFMLLVVTAGIEDALSDGRSKGTRRGSVCI